MPRKVKNFSALEVSRIEKTGRHAVGNVPGLLLVLKESGAKSWIFRTWIGGKRRNMGLGGYPATTLKMAIEKARNAKDLIEQGIDPIEKKHAAKRELINANMSKMSFADAAVKCHKIKTAEFKNKKHIQDWISSLKRYAFPVIGQLPVSEIDVNHILEILNPIWNEKTETANRLRNRIETVLSWATAGGYREGLNPARWKDNLAHLLAKPKEIKKKSHFKALPYKDIASFLVDLKKRQGMAAKALEFIIYTACRSGEVRFATWDEIDLKNRLWTIPADRMKNKVEHRVPLTDSAISLLQSLPSESGLLFPAQKGGVLSDMAISMLCRRMKVEAVPHGFRSTFKDWATETTGFPDIVSEIALAHTVGTEVRAAYQRGDLLVKRRKLMDAWAEYLVQVRTENMDNVTPIKRALK